jgi:hypothetical protein
LLVRTGNRSLLWFRDPNPETKITWLISMLIIQVCWSKIPHPTS